MSMKYIAVPHFCVVKLGFTGVCLFFLFLLQNIDCGRRNISIGIPLNLSIPTEMGYIEPLVENENSAKLQNCVILT